MNKNLLKKIEVKTLPNVLFTKDKAGLALFTEQIASQTPFSTFGELGGNLVSQRTNELQKTIHNLVSIKSPSAQIIGGHKTLSEKLYDATSEVKILTSQVAMYLNREWRDRIFKRLDNMHDISEWDSDASPIQRASFKTFLKAAVELMPTRHPSLGLSDKGLLLAAWATDDGLLTTEFLPNDGIRWSLSVSIDGEVDRAVGTTSVARFLSCLSPYHPKKWFHEEAAKKR